MELTAESAILLLHLQMALTMILIAIPFDLTKKSIK